MSDLIDKVLSDPEALWAVMTSGKKVAGPWEPAGSEKKRVGYSKGSLWRLNPNGDYLALVCPSSKLREPIMSNYLLGDDEGYEEDCRLYEEALKKWKPWSFYIERVGYSEPDDKKKYGFNQADSPEEACERADQILRERGVLLRGE